MKKIVLIFCLALMGLAAQANSINVQNLLPNPITLTFRCTNPDGTTPHSVPVTLNPGPNFFANPTLIPGLAGSASVNARVTLVYGFCNPYDLGLGSPNATPSSGMQHIPAGNSCNGAAFDMTWNEGNVAPYNAVILIF